MSIKKLILTALIALALIGSFPLTSYAAYGWYVVSVKQIGPAGDGNIYVLLNDEGGAFTDKWFICYSPQANRQMAIILTAMTNSLTLRVYVNPDETVTTSRFIANMYMIATSN